MTEELFKIPVLKFYDLAGVATPMMLSLLALAGLLLDSWIGKKKPSWIGGFSLAGMVMILVFQALLQVLRANLRGDVGTGFGGIIFFDLFGIFFNYLFLGSALLTVGISLSYLSGKEYHRGEYYILILIATAGMSLLASSRDLIMAFLGLETMSIPVYALAGADRFNLKSNEASLKYVLLGAFASAILLYGIALLYGAGGALDFLTLSRELGLLRPPDLRYFLMAIGLGLVIIGFGFKIAVVPFHMWVPDVYEGAPTPITGYMATGVKSAGFAILIRLLLIPFVDEWSQLWQVVRALAITTMVVGNLLALVQNNLKRMLAYSSIAHAGYLLVGLTALVSALRNSMMDAFGPCYAMMYYLLVYLFMTIGAFTVMVILSQEGRGGEMIDDYSDLAQKRPFLAGLMAIFMFSLAGVPPFGGFFAKFYIFQFAIHNQLYWLTIIAVLNSVLGAYYYLRVVYVMYMQREREELVKPTVETGVLINTVLIFSAVMVIILGLAPGQFLDIIFMTFRKFV